MRSYEMVLVTKTDLTPEISTSIKKRIEDVVAQFEGTMTKMEDKGKRKLAYEIKKSLKGNYYDVAFTAKAGVVREIEHYMRINENVLRFQTIVLSSSRTSLDRFKKKMELKTPKSESSHD